MTTITNKIDEIYTPHVPTFAKKYFEYLGEVLGKIDVNSIDNFIKLILAARERGSKIFFIGNGGSAATASHFANDLAVGSRSVKKPFKAIALTDNNAVMTAIANDFGYDELFTKQLQYLLEKNDLVVAISASGNSPNIVKAMEYANQHGAITIGLTGFEGGALRKLAQHNIHVPSTKGEYGPVEDAHMVIDHLMGAYMIKLVQSES